MKDGKFETRAQIWKHLLEGGRIKNGNVTGHSFLKEGELYHSDGFRDVSAFHFPKEWSIYEEPKTKKKVTLYRYTYQLCSGEIKTSYWTSLNFSEYYDENPDTRLMRQILKESKEVEYDDV